MATSLPVNIGLPQGAHFLDGTPSTVAARSITEIGSPEGMKNAIAAVVSNTPDFRKRPSKAKPIPSDSRPFQQSPLAQISFSLSSTGPPSSSLGRSALTASLSNPPPSSVPPQPPTIQPPAKDAEADAVDWTKSFIPPHVLAKRDRAEEWFSMSMEDD
jgi:hypothetical protein